MHRRPPLRGSSGSARYSVEAVGRSPARLIAGAARVLRPFANVRRTVTRHTAALILPVAYLWLSACGQSAVRPLNRTSHGGLPRPARITLADFPFSNAALLEYQGIFRQQPRNPNASERQREMGNEVSQAFRIELADRLRALGFTVEPASTAEINGDDTLLIKGEFLRIDEGNALRRFVIGLGSGAANLQARVRVYQGRKQLLEFTAEADSGKMPGAVITAPAGAATPPVISAGILTGNALSGLRNRTGVAELARSSAEQASRYLSEFFVRQRWIREEQMKRARIAR